METLLGFVENHKQNYYTIQAKDQEDVHEEPNMYIFGFVSLRSLLGSFFCSRINQNDHFGSSCFGSTDVNKEPENEEPKIQQEPENVQTLVQHFTKAEF